MWHYITFAVQIKNLEKSTMPTGTNRAGQDSYVQPHKFKLLHLLPFLDVSCQIISDTKNPTDPNPSFGGSFCFSAAVIAHLSFFSRSYLCWRLQPQTSASYITGLRCSRCSWLNPACQAWASSSGKYVVALVIFKGSKKNMLQPMLPLGPSVSLLEPQRCTLHARAGSCCCAHSSSTLR